MPSSSATVAACTAPAPPNGSSVKAERSTPRLAANTRTSSAMRISTMRWMPAAAVITSIFRGSPTLRLERGTRCRDVELLRAAEEIVRVEIAAHEVGIGDRRPRAAASVAGRAGIGAGALRADIEEPAAVDPGDRAAAGGDRGHVERRHVDLPARDHAFGDLERRAAFDEGDVGAGAAHVEGDEPGSRLGSRKMRARLRARGGAGEQRMHGAAARDRRRERHHAAVRLHQEALLRAQPGRVQSFVEMTDVVHHDRLEIGVEQRRGEPRPFADARQDLARQRDVDGRKFVLDQRARFPLMRRIHEREQVTDRDRTRRRRP